MKVILRPKKSNGKSVGKERITLQFRCYDKTGKYKIEIHLKDCNLFEAFEIVKTALMNKDLFT
jgi:hypothetical protein